VFNFANLHPYSIFQASGQVSVKDELSKLGEQMLQSAEGLKEY
jgi:hypothetical protein